MILAEFQWPLQGVAAHQVDDTGRRRPLRPASTGARLRRHAGGPLAGVVLTALLVGGSATAADAAEDGRKPLLREKIDMQMTEEVDPFALEVCGVALRFDGRVRGQFVLYGDLTTRQHLNIDYVWSDPATGDPVFVERDAETFFQVPISETVDEQAGTLTTVYETRITGLPLKGRVPGEGVLIRDAGRITEVATVVTDLATGELMSVDAEFGEVRGPHPFAAMTPEERDALFCSAVGG
jgi:hypothetical protein